jgi:hypothetical protein
VILVPFSNEVFTRTSLFEIIQHYCLAYPGFE